MQKSNLQTKPIYSEMSTYGLENHSISNPGPVHWNLSTEELVAEAKKRGEGRLTNTGALSCFTGEHTGRSPKDKFIVKDKSTEDNVDWGAVNQSISPKHFAALQKDQLNYLEGRELFVRDAFGGADLKYRLPIRIITESAWANLFAKHLFIRPKKEELINHVPQFTIIHTPGFSANPEVHGTRSKTFIVVNFTEGLILIGGTEYAGEIKKSIFSILNYLYPLKNVLSMHCSANVTKTGEENAALFFGLSGTGKTTLSADPHRALIGDDEHGWSDRGIFNFEGGCYAKCINLTEEKEPDIFRAIRDGVILENVVVDEKTGNPNYEDSSLTENTRAAYPLDYIEGAVESGMAGHPKNIVFLTCDAFGVMPPISKLTPEAAMYHFLSGYTAKVAGTEKGMGNTPQATFSTCFGSPFIPLRPTVYADLLGKKIAEHKVDCWLVNTGWVGGGVGVGNRMKLSYTRRMVRAIVDGELKNVALRNDPIFNVAIPESVPDVPTEVLDQEKLWEDKTAYKKTVSDLAGRFRDNFKKFASYAPHLVDAGPRA